MFNHTGKAGFRLFSVEPQSPFLNLYLFISIADKFAVPVFFMISGALLLRKVESFSTVYKRRFLKMLAILFLTSVVYQIYYCTRDNQVFQMAAFFRRFYSKNFSVALWYLYAYLGILTVLPFFQKLAHQMTVQDFLYMAGLFILLTGIRPIVEYRLWHGELAMNSIFQRWTTFISDTTGGRSVVFLFLGYFLEHVLPERHYTVKNALVGVLLSVLAIGVCCYITVYKAKFTGIQKSVEMFHMNLTVIPACTIYFCAKLFFKRIHVSPRTENIIYYLGGTVFGIFLLEGILRRETQFVFKALEPSLGTMSATFVWIFCALVLGIVVTSLLKKIPLIKRYI